MSIASNMRIIFLLSPCKLRYFTYHHISRKRKYHYSLFLIFIYSRNTGRIGSEISSGIAPLMIVSTFSKQYLSFFILYNDACSCLKQRRMAYNLAQIHNIITHCPSPSQFNLISSGLQFVLIILYVLFILLAI